jgi:uncharacterized protein
MARPFVVNVREVLQHPGTQRELEVVGRLPGLALPSTWVPDDADVHVVATLEAQAGSVVLKGTATAPWVGECRRCLDATGGTVEVDLHEVFEKSPVDGETFLLDSSHDQADLTPMLREALTLALPLAPLCRDDCAGPDPDAHPVRSPEADVGDDEAEPPRDPRWAVLDQFRVDR